MIKHKRFKLNKLLSLIMALALVATLLPLAATPAFAAGAASYTDTGTHWASSAIDKWSGMGILQGYDGKFRPDDPITRGEVAVIIDRIMDYQTAAKNDFNDLGQAFYTNAVLKANAAGVVLGYDGKVRPTDNITREDATVMLGRALGIEESTAALSFADADSVSSYAKGYVTAFAVKGYINGYNGSFNPKSAISRAEVVTILNNAISGFFNEAKEYTGTYAGVVVVNKSGATLKDTVINGDLIIAEGIGNGDVTLDNVKVTGNTIVRGGGENSIHIKGGSYTSLIIEKTDDGRVRVVTSSGAAVNAVYVDDGNDDVILTGSFGNVTMNADVNVVVDRGSNVATLTVAVSGVTVTNNGSVGTLNVNADGIVVGGNKPSVVNVGSSVTKPPVDTNGNPLKGNSVSTTGGTGGGVVNQDQAAPSASLFTVTAPSAQGASDGSIAISNITGLQFSANGTSYTNVTASPITGLAAGSYYFKYAAKTGFNESLPTIVTVPAGSAAEAQVGSTYYATFAAAIAAAQTNNGADTITLLRSITINAAVSIDANDTLVIPSGVTLTDEGSYLIGGTGAALIVQTGGSFVLVPWGEYGVFSAGQYIYDASGAQWSPAQARIGDTYFANLDAAIAAANANTAQDEIDVLGNNAISTYVNGDITFGAAASGSDILTVPTGGSIYIRGSGSAGAALRQAGGTLTNNGYIQGNAFTASGGTIDVSGIFNVSSLSVGGATQTWHSGAVVIIDGATITGVTGFSASADGSYRYNGTGWDSAPACVEHDGVTTYYASFKNALAAAVAGDKVYLILSYSVEAGSELTIPASVMLTIDTHGLLTIKSGGGLTINGELYLVTGTGLVAESGGKIGGSGRVEVSGNTLDLTVATQDFSAGAVFNASNSGTYVTGLTGTSGAQNGIFIYTGTAWVVAEGYVYDNNTGAETFCATLAEALAVAHGNGSPDNISMRGYPTLTTSAQVDASDTLYLGYSLTVDEGAVLTVNGTLDFSSNTLFTVNGTLAFGAGGACGNLHANSSRITVGASGSVTGITDSNRDAFVANSAYVYNGSGWVKQ
jgi:hypothetical protein